MGIMWCVHFQEDKILLFYVFALRFHHPDKQPYTEEHIAREKTYIHQPIIYFFLVVVIEKL